MCLKLTIIKIFMWKYNYSLFWNFSKKSYYVETSQLTCKALQLTGFYMIWGFSERFFRGDYNEDTIKIILHFYLSSEYTTQIDSTS